LVRWSPQSHQIKDFLARNQVPYQWLDIEAGEEAHRLVQYTLNLIAHTCRWCCSLMVHAIQPSSGQIAEKIGLRTRAEKPFYDLGYRVVVRWFGSSGLWSV